MGDLILIVIFGCMVYAAIELCLAVIVGFLWMIAATLFGIGFGIFGLIGVVMWFFGKKIGSDFLSVHLLRISTGCVLVSSGMAIFTGNGFTKKTPIVTQESFWYFFKHDVTRYQESETIWSQLFYVGLIASLVFLITWAVERYMRSKANQ
jgi:membrane-bound ClpP family serine protease